MLRRVCKIVPHPERHQVLDAHEPEDDLILRVRRPLSSMKNRNLDFPVKTFRSRHQAIEVLEEYQNTELASSEEPADGSVKERP